MRKKNNYKTYIKQTLTFTFILNDFFKTSFIYSEAFKSRLEITVQLKD